MTKKIISAAFLCSIFISLFAQGKISGNVVDGATNEALAFANIVLYENEKVLQGVATDTEGAFVFQNIPYGKYRLTVDFASYKTEMRQLEITPSQETIHLKTIVLQENAKMLREVEIVGIASKTKFDIDKKIYTVNQSALSAGAGTDEILRNIPSVNVDNEGNISLRNDENVQVWINGKPSGLTAENRGQILEQLPAESVESVEVITNPSAKYNPEGTSGIINIVLRKDRKAGYYGTVSAGVSYPWGANIGGNVNYSNKKFDSYLNLNYRNNKHIGGGWLNRTTFGQDTTFLNQNNEMENYMQGLFARAGVDYRINDKNTIGISGFTVFGGGERERNYDYHLWKNDMEIDRYTQQTLSDNEQFGRNFVIDYKHVFDKRGHELTANAGYSAFNMDSNTDYFTKRTSGDFLREEDLSNRSKEFSLQADYILPFGEKSKLEAGYKSTYSPGRNILEYHSILNDDDFTLNRQVHAIYANYKNVFKPLGVGYLLGVRGEESITDWKNTDKKGSSSSFDLFPSLFLSKTFGKGNEIQLSATRRINRPGRRQLNPLPDVSDSTNIRYGNPDLKAEYSWAYELSYIKSWGSHSLATSAYLRQTADVIQPVSTLEENGKYLETTYKNITSRQNSGVELSLKNRFLRIIELTSTANAYYSKLEGNSEYKLSGRESFSWDVRVIGNVLIRKGFSGQLTGNYRSPMLLPQGKRLANYSFDAGLRKTFMEKINVNLSVRDIFNSRKDKQRLETENFLQNSEMYFGGRTVRLTVSYNFGNLKPTKKTKKEEDSLDLDTEM